MKKQLSLSLLLVFSGAFAQDFSFNFNTTGQRVCLLSAEADVENPSITVHFLDAAANISHPTDLYRRPAYGNVADWTLIADNLPAGTPSFTDTNVNVGEVWEYQARRANTWFYAGESHDAFGYTSGAVMADKTGYAGRVILLAADNIASGLPEQYARLKGELTGDGWLVQDLIVPKATGWDSGNLVVGIRDQIIVIYNSAPENDKPKALFILGHVPMPRSGLGAAVAPDDHNENRGARGCDAYYADIDGVFTDSGTYNPGNLQTPLAVNLPGDFKWDQDFFPSDIEMAFGRVDFEDVDDVSGSELELMETYLDKLHNYRTVASGWDMGAKSGFNIGYDNSNDGAYRSLPNLSKPADLIQKTASLPHPQWVSQNGPFKIYMQNQQVPDISEWNTFGMDAAVFTSDQSYWGWNDVPQNNYIYSRIRALLATPTKCIATIWTTTGVNTFFQACTGDPIGFGVREIMNHNALNNNMERAPQNWDTAAWQNRTHFAFNGDPTIRLYQVQPAQDAALNLQDGQVVLSWTEAASAEIIGYQVYRSDSEFGKYEKISDGVIDGNSFVIDGFSADDWFMVRSVSEMESGCGKFLSGGNGVFVSGAALGRSEMAENRVKMFPNPASGIALFSGIEEPSTIVIVSADGRVVLQTAISSDQNTVDLTTLASGVYSVRISSGDKSDVKKLLKR